MKQSELPRLVRSPLAARCVLMKNCNSGFKIQIIYDHHCLVKTHHRVPQLCRAETLRGCSAGPTILSCLVLSAVLFKQIRIVALSRRQL